MKTTKPDISLPAMASGNDNQHPATTSGYIKALKKLSQRRNSVIGFPELSIADIDLTQAEPQLTPLRFEAGVERARIVNHAPFGHVGALLRRRSSLQTLKPTLDSVLQTFPANNCSAVVSDDSSEQPEHSNISLHSNTLDVSSHTDVQATLISQNDLKVDT